MGLIVFSSLFVSFALSEHHILAFRNYYARKWERLVSDALSEKEEAELQLKTKTAEIERLTKKVATLEGELSDLRANSSKHQ